MSIWRPRTSVQVVSIDRPEFTPNHGLFARYPEVTARFEEKKVCGTVTSLTLAFDGAMLEDVSRTHLDIAACIFASMTDFILEDQSCEHLSDDSRKELTPKSQLLLETPNYDALVQRYGHWLTHVGYNMMLGYAERSGYTHLPGMPDAVEPADRSGPFDGTYRIFYGFDVGRYVYKAGAKLGMLSEVGIGVLEGDVFSHQLADKWWNMLLQEPETDLIEDKYPWNYYTGLSETLR